MGRGSLKASKKGIEAAKKALLRNGLTQKALGETLEISRSTISKFFNGKTVERYVFEEICKRLNLNREETFEPPSEEEQNNCSRIDSLAKDIFQKIDPYIQGSQNPESNMILQIDLSSIYIQIKTLKHNIRELVQGIRQQVQGDIEESCGTMRVLDMTQPIKLGSIYTQLNILEKITGRRRIDFTKLAGDDSETFDRFGLSRVEEKGLEGLEVVRKYNKLMVLGKPGAGKTTFLKYLAIECSKGEFIKNCVPVFIPLKQFAETKDKPSLLDYISQWLDKCGLTEAQAQLEQLLKAGRLLILLDGLDEVREEDSERTIKEIRNFSQEFSQPQYIKKIQKFSQKYNQSFSQKYNQSFSQKYNQSWYIKKSQYIKEIQDFYQEFSPHQFVITCRIASREYTFEQFTEVEVADFKDEQINNFAKSWFQIKKLDQYADDFIQQLKDNPQIRELATNPLLLTLLCLEFEDARSFPADRAELYKRATQTLLRKWDDKRGIKRQQVYKQLSVKRKEDLLSQVAFSTFREKHYFFKREIVENHIANYISNLPDTPADTEKLHLDSEAVLKSIEAHHGLLVERAKSIYSFSHLTFQEYFTAEKIVSEQKLADLVKHITETRWREVFLLTAGMLSNVDELLTLMKQQVDRLLAKDKKLQKFLTWANSKANSLETSYKKATIPIFFYIILNRYLSADLSLESNRDLIQNLSRYFSRDLKLNFILDLSLDLNQDLSRDLKFNFSQYLSLNLSLEIILDLFLNLIINLSEYFNLTLDLDCDIILDLSLYLSLDLNLYIAPEMKQELQNLKMQLPKEDSEPEMIKQWWLENGESWSNHLRNVMIKYRDIGHDWEFTQEQEKSLEQYLDANKLLLDCLENGYVTRDVREEIESTLFLPFEQVKNQFDKNFELEL
ncbi:NACHT domain-containing protein [Mastigocoleus testarum]|uniref:Uncharacterized protein n=1 Tax=Mastigocoleus testarum BC008 TaxID=371196 RepID=A0A0V7ZPY9_9CYAN|nr:NACHT domain-containing NTPase [Mastigocoleus testarum]KST66568.1 hypothetical protein BC008_43390 [Mastigocoleus testarum BC008]